MKTNTYHEANRLCWDAWARGGGGQIDQTRQWRECWESMDLLGLPRCLLLLARKQA